MVSIKQIKNAVREVLDENEYGIEPLVYPPLQKMTFQPASQIRTQDVIDSLFNYRRHKGVKTSTIATYEKRLSLFAKSYPVLPLDTETILNYLDRFSKADSTGRYKRNHHDLLKMLYRHAVSHMGVSDNPLEELERPLVNKKRINTLSLTEIKTVNGSTEDITEKVVWQLLQGHGWRQVEVRRITAGDVRAIKDGMIWCRGKERNENAPLLPETQCLLEQLAQGLADDDLVIRSTRIRAGGTQPLGEDGMQQLIQRVLARAGIKKTGHDLRRTFATIVHDASGDEFLAMRLLRDIIPGVSDRYINFSADKMKTALLKYSPLRLINHIQEGETPFQTGESLVETGEGRTPSHRNILILLKQRRAMAVKFL